MNIEQAQADMRHAYLGGATGIFASGCVWLTAAITAMVSTDRAAILALFIGGMFIHPLAMLLSKLAGRPGTHGKANPLARLAIESTVWLLLAIPIAFLASLQRPEWFFVGMLLTIGGRYFTFATLYGMRIYWAVAPSWPARRSHSQPSTPTAWLRPALAPASNSFSPALRSSPNNAKWGQSPFSRARCRASWSREWS